MWIAPLKHPLKKNLRHDLRYLSISDTEATEYNTLFVQHHLQGY